MGNKKFILIFTVLAFVIGGVLYTFYPTPNKYESPEGENELFCTQDVMSCPDGSYVSRDPKNGCQFKACPIPPGAIMEDGTIPDTNTPAPPTKEDNQVFCTMEAKLCPDGSYVGRIGPKCEFAACPTPKPQY